VACRGPALAQGGGAVTADGQLEGRGGVEAAEGSKYSGQHNVKVDRQRVEMRKGPPGVSLLVERWRWGRGANGRLVSGPPAADLLSAAGQIGDVGLNYLDLAGSSWANDELLVC
jgi:hypothetical protein